MGIVMLYALFGGAIATQVTPSPETAQQEQAKKLAQAKMALTHAVAAGKPCAVPLRNVLPAATPQKIVVVPPQSGKAQLPMAEVAVPAPSCADLKK